LLQLFDELARFFRFIVFVTTRCGSLDAEVVEELLGLAGVFAGVRAD
jgi:hypothetical protein